MVHELNTEQLYEDRVEDLWMFLCYPGFSIQLLDNGDPDNPTKRIGFYRNHRGLTELVIFDNNITFEDYPYVYPSLDLDSIKNPDKTNYPWTSIGNITSLSLYNAIRDMLKAYMDPHNATLIIDISNPYHILIKSFEDMHISESEWAEEKVIEIYDSNLCLSYEEKLKAYYIWP